MLRLSEHATTPYELYLEGEVTRLRAELDRRKEPAPEPIFCGEPSTVLDVQGPHSETWHIAAKGTMARNEYHVPHLVLRSYGDYAMEFSAYVSGLEVRNEYWSTAQRLAEIHRLMCEQIISMHDKRRSA